MKKFPHRSPRNARGMVTAELAVGMIAVAMLLTLCFGVAGLIVTQLRCVESASEIARQSARGDAKAVATARRAVPKNAKVDVRRRGNAIEVSVSAPVQLKPLPAVDVTGRAQATVEPGQ